MSFQAYIDNVRAKTGHTPEDFRRLAGEQGMLRAGVKAEAITGWLQQEFGLGLGHARAIYATLKPHLPGPAPVSPRAPAPRREA